jgi:glucose-6-phosphate isomerase
MMTLPYRQDVTAATKALENLDVGFDVALLQTGAVLTTINTWYQDKTLPLLRLPEAKDDISVLETIAERIASTFKTVVVLGTGGSSLGGQTLYALVDLGFGNVTNRPKLYFLDNVDAVSFDHLFQHIDLKSTYFLAISKSGGTAETLSQLFVCLGALEKAGLKPQDHLLAITEQGSNPLRTLTEQLGIETLEHDAKVGGRFSVLSNVALLPAMIAGVDVVALRQGAKVVLDTVLLGNPLECPPAVGAALAVAGCAGGKTISVLMPYADELSLFGLWYRQLWAESLGKQGKGTTPVRAMGTVDQHSQMQLYLDGPQDKIFTVLIKATAGQGYGYPPHLLGDDRLKYLKNTQMGDLLLAEAKATVATFISKDLPVRVIDIKTMDAYTLGALLMHFMLETIITAGLLGIDAFDQPAVEQGKILTRQYLLEKKLAA